MSPLNAADEYGVLTEPTTLKIQRRLPGPVERVWNYLTQNDLRRQWLASGEMVMAADAPFEFVWRNDELTDPPGKRPDGFGEEHRMQCRIIEVQPLRKLMFTWGNASDVTIELEQQGKDVLLTLIHRRIVDRASLLNVSSGWHAHLNVLAAKLNGIMPPPHWDVWSQLKQEYEQRLTI